MIYLNLMDASLREENTEGVLPGQLIRVKNPDFLEVGVSLREELQEHGLLELFANDSAVRYAAHEVRVEELVEAGVHVHAVLWVLEEEVVPQGLDLPHHHVLHSIQSFRRTEKNRGVLVN